MSIQLLDSRLLVFLQAVADAGRRDDAEGAVVVVRGQILLFGLVQHPVSGSALTASFLSGRTCVA